ncbi:hypothetical protein [Bradyrhizobium murdochi]|uniref:hypothetical protein n=1 Tax=Bradyrhizobium murdochi TaxID=1038859 RepID=UPI0012EB28C9|nr:hypothetical protein [Bradyrhizobium murdochi]
MVPQAEALTEALNGSKATKAERSLIERIVQRSGLTRETFSFSSIAGTFTAKRQASRRGIGALRCCTELDPLEARHRAVSTQIVWRVVTSRHSKDPNHCEHSWRSAMLKLLPRLGVR